MKLLDTAEQQYHELEAKHAQLEKDKKQLYETIEQLDEKKKRELIAAHKQISQVCFLINRIIYNIFEGFLCNLFHAFAWSQCRTRSSLRNGKLPLGTWGSGCVQWEV